MTRATTTDLKQNLWFIWFPIYLQTPNKPDMIFLLAIFSRWSKILKYTVAILFCFFLCSKIISQRKCSWSSTNYVSLGEILTSNFSNPLFLHLSSGNRIVVILDKLIRPRYIKNSPVLILSPYPLILHIKQIK